MVRKKKKLKKGDIYAPSTEGKYTGVLNYYRGYLHFQWRQTILNLILFVILI